MNVRLREWPNPLERTESVGKGPFPSEADFFLGNNRVYVQNGEFVSDGERREWLATEMRSHVVDGVSSSRNDSFFTELSHALQRRCEETSVVLMHDIKEEGTADPLAVLSSLNQGGRWYRYVYEPDSGTWYDPARPHYQFPYRPLDGGRLRAVETRRAAGFVAGAAKAIGLSGGPMPRNVAELAERALASGRMDANRANLIFATAEQVGETLSAERAVDLLVASIRSLDTSDWQGFLTGWNQTLDLAYRYRVDLYHDPNVHAYVFDQMADAIGSESPVVLQWRTFAEFYGIDWRLAGTVARDAAYARMAEAWERGEPQAVSDLLGFFKQAEILLDPNDDRLVDAQAGFVLRRADVARGESQWGGYDETVRHTLWVLLDNQAPVERVLQRASGRSSDFLAREWRLAMRRMAPAESARDLRERLGSYYETMRSSDEPLPFDRNDLHRVLNDSAHTPADVLELLSGIWEEWFEADAGVREGHTLREHVGMVLGQFRKYQADKPFPEGFPRALFELTLVLHDIGKPLAAAQGKPEEQHAYTVALMESVLEKLGYSETERRAATALVGADPLGTYVKYALYKTDPGLVSTCVRQIESMSDASGLPLETFWDLLLRYYQSDAGSYTEDAGSESALDHLFVFDHERGRSRFSPQVIDSCLRSLNDAVGGRIRERAGTAQRPVALGERGAADVHFRDEHIGRWHGIPAAEIRPVFRDHIPDQTFADMTNEAWIRAVQAGSVPARDTRAEACAAARRSEPNVYEWGPTDIALLERAVIQFARENSDLFLSALYMMGREADPTFVEELERKYSVNLEYAKIAVGFFQLQDLKDRCATLLNPEYGSDVNAPETRQELRELCGQIAEMARELADYEIPTAHCVQNDAAIPEIETAGQLFKSNKLSDFEGDGVYVGAFGSYRWWGKDDATYHMRVPLAYAHPTIIITRGGTGFPQAMANVLSDGIILRSSELPVHLRGMVQWRMMNLVDEYNSHLPDWKVDMVRDCLGLKEHEVRVREDEFGYPVLVADTDAPPIVWAELCRALRISRFVPSSELERFGIDGPIPWDSRLTRADIRESTIYSNVDSVGSGSRLVGGGDVVGVEHVPNVRGLARREEEEWAGSVGPTLLPLPELPEIKDKW